MDRWTERDATFSCTATSMILSNNVTSKSRPCDLDLGVLINSKM